MHCLLDRLTKAKIRQEFRFTKLGESYVSLKLIIRKTKYRHKIGLQKSLIGRYRILETKQEY